MLLIKKYTNECYKQVTIHYYNFKIWRQINMHQEVQTEIKQALRFFGKQNQYNELKGIHILQFAAAFNYFKLKRIKISIQIIGAYLLVFWQYFLNEYLKTQWVLFTLTYCIAFIGLMYQRKYFFGIQLKLMLLFGCYNHYELQHIYSCIILVLVFVAIMIYDEPSLFLIRGKYVDLRILMQGCLMLLFVFQKINKYHFLADEWSSFQITIRCQFYGLLIAGLQFFFSRRLINGPSLCQLMLNQIQNTVSLWWFLVVLEGKQCRIEVYLYMLLQKMLQLILIKLFIEDVILTGYEKYRMVRLVKVRQNEFIINWANQTPIQKYRTYQREIQMESPIFEKQICSKCNINTANFLSYRNCSHCVFCVDCARKEAYKYFKSLQIAVIMCPVCKSELLTYITVSLKLQHLRNKVDLHCHLFADRMKNQFNFTFQRVIGDLIQE